MSAAKVTVREAGGRVVGPLAVHGDGGPLAFTPMTLGRLHTAIRMATAGHALVGFYEPTPGHVRAYQHTGAADTDETVIDLRGAELVTWEA